MATQEQNPQDVLIRGRLSWPNFTYAEALRQNASSKFKRPEEEVRPNYNLLLEEDQLDKLVDHLQNVFIPWCLEQEKAGAKSGLTAAQAKKLNRVLDAREWDVDPLFGLINPVHAKTAELAPEAVASVRINGYRGQDIEQRAVVRNESQLANPTEDIIIPPRGLIMAVEETTHQLYPGSVVASQLNLFAFQGANVGISATGAVAIFLRDAERFGGGGSIDEDAVMDFIDD